MRSTHLIQNAAPVEGKAARIESKDDCTEHPTDNQGLSPKQIARLSQRPINNVYAAIRRLALLPIPDNCELYPSTLAKVIREL